MQTLCLGFKQKIFLLPGGKGVGGGGSAKPSFAEASILTPEAPGVLQSLDSVPKTHCSSCF